MSHGPTGERWSLVLSLPLTVTPNLDSLTLLSFPLRYTLGLSHAGPDGVTRSIASNKIHE